MIISPHSYRVIICVINLSLRFISRFGRFHEDFPLKEGTERVPLPFSRNRPKNHSHNLGKALGEGLGLLCAPFTSLYLSLSYLSLPLYISHSTFLSLSLLLCVILFGVSNGRFRPCFIWNAKFLDFTDPVLFIGCRLGLFFQVLKIIWNRSIVCS